MTTIKNKTPLTKEHCFTYDEASEILKFLVDGDLQYFLQVHGFVGNFGIPFDVEFGNKVFRYVYSKKSPLEGEYYKHIYITESGLRKFFDIAMSRYLLERPIQKFF